LLKGKLSETKIQPNLHYAAEGPLETRQDKENVTEENES
jgi:hypothetical protein